MIYFYAGILYSILCIYHFPILEEKMDFDLNIVKIFRSCTGPFLICIISCHEL